MGGVITPLSKPSVSDRYPEQGTKDKGTDPELKSMCNSFSLLRRDHLSIDRHRLEERIANLLNSFAARVTLSRDAKSSSRKMASFPVSCFNCKEYTSCQMWERTEPTKLSRTAAMAASAFSLEREAM